MDERTEEALIRSVTLGTARQPVALGGVLGGAIKPDDPKALLKAVALLGQRSRFTRPVAATPVAEAALFADPRPLVPEPVRPLLLSLLAGKSGQADDALALAIADRLAARGLRLHPFDLPRLDAFVGANGEVLGPAALAWSARRSAEPAASRVSLFAEVVDETNWMLGRTAQRAAFIRGLRRRDPDRARGLVEAAFPSEPAPVRVALLRSLTEGLGAADEPFLQSLAKDRAPTVREAAEALLLRLPGSAGSAKRLAECLSRLKLTRKGFLRRQAAVTLDFPATVNVHQREEWACAAFAGIGLDALAGGLGVALNDLVEAAAGDDVLRIVLAVLAADERRYDLVARLVQSGAASAWVAMVKQDGLSFADAAEATRWCAAALQPAQWADMSDLSSLPRLYQILRGPLPETVFRGIAVCRSWQVLVSVVKDRDALWAGVVAALAALTPAGDRARCRAMLDPLPPALAGRALNGLTLFDRIDAA